MIEKRWILADPVPLEIGQQLPNYSPIERQLLMQRGMLDAELAERYLQRRYTGDPDPFQLEGMEQAVKRVTRARDQGERVAVYGDYDADGITATALMVETLESAGLQVDWYIPDRFTEGYGLNAEAIAKLKQAGAELLVSVDCGIRAVETVERAEIDIIITDHHLPGLELPPAVAVVNPNRAGDSYPFKGLAGVGIAFKFAQALDQSLGLDIAGRVLDLVAVGTVADLAPLELENRQLVWQGIQQLNTAARPGLRALAEHAGYGHQRPLDASALGYGIGPRLNAAGRMADAKDAVRLLLSRSGPDAWAHAAKLEELNRQRQKLTGDMLEQARKTADQDQLAESLIFAVGPQFHLGVMGLVASQLVEQAYRPALVARLDQGFITGSARSIPEFHVTEALDQCADLLVKYGGHRQAAGFTLAAEHLQAFAARIDDLARERLSGQDLRPSLDLAAMLDFSELSDELMDFIEGLEPSGAANPTPVFGTEAAVVLSKRTVGAQGRHLKLSLRQADRVFDAIAFNFGDRIDLLPRMVDVAYRLERNVFRGVVSLQLNVQDLKGRGS